MEHKSHFENKIIIKDKVKKRMEKIIGYEELRKRLVWNNPRKVSKQTHKLINEKIQKQKDKINKDTEIYFYG